LENLNVKRGADESAPLLTFKTKLVYSEIERRDRA